MRSEKISKRSVHRTLAISRRSNPAKLAPQMRARLQEQLERYYQDLRDQVLPSGNLRAAR